METAIKTPLDIIQELIAILTTRKEVVEKLSEKVESEDTRGKMHAVKGQTDQFIAGLLAELAEFGDAVKDSPDRDNEYQDIWKKAMGNMEGINADATFNDLEQSLKKTYENILTTTKELPESLLQVLTFQKEQL